MAFISLCFLAASTLWPAASSCCHHDGLVPIAQIKPPTLKLLLLGCFTTTGKIRRQCATTGPRNSKPLLFVNWFPQVLLWQNQLTHTEAGKGPCPELSDDSVASCWLRLLFQSRTTSFIQPLVMFVSAFSSFRYGKSINGIHHALLPGPVGSFYEFEVGWLLWCWGKGRSVNEISSWQWPLVSEFLLSFFF